MVVIKEITCISLSYLTLPQLKFIVYVRSLAKKSKSSEITIAH